MSLKLKYLISTWIKFSMCILGLVVSFFFKDSSIGIVIICAISLLALNCSTDFLRYYEITITEAYSKMKQKKHLLNDERRQAYENCTEQLECLSCKKDCINKYFYI